MSDPIQPFYLIGGFFVVALMIWLGVAYGAKLEYKAPKAEQPTTTDPFDHQRVTEQSNSQWRQLQRPTHQTLKISMTRSLIR